MMKKHCFALFLACLLLCGCSAQSQSEETAPSTDATAPATEPKSIYVPGSALEIATDGAVRCYPLQDAHAAGVLTLGGNVMVFTQLEEQTLLTVYSSDTMAATASLTLDGYLSGEELQTFDGGFSFFDESAMETVVLDNSLREIKRVAAPENLCGTPILSSDRSTLYYFTADSLRALELETGISRCLKEMTFPEQTLTGLWLEDTVLQCEVCDGERREILFLSAETGQLLGEALNSVTFTAYSDRYYVVSAESSIRHYLFGSLETDIRAMAYQSSGTEYHFLPKDNAAVVIHKEADTTAALVEYYDLDTGLCTASQTMDFDFYPSDVESDGQGHIYFLSYDNSFARSTLYRWDTSCSPSDTLTVYTTPVYTREEPDQAGLSACTLYAQEIGDKYGIDILIYEDAAAVPPSGCELTSEYLVPVIQEELELLDARLGSYPKGFLPTLAECFNGLQIHLVRDISSITDSGQDDVAGLKYLDESYTAHIYLIIGKDSEHALYHTLCHLIDTRVLTESSAYDTWDKLNPSDFEYDYDYAANRSRDGSVYVNEKRYFIDTYSMSFPAEDRARIMEYAMTGGNEACFQSTYMQAKLLAMCKGIREAFGLKKSPETFLWEQYLNTSLAYTE